MFKFSEFEQRISSCDLPPDDKAVILLAVSTCWNGILITAATNQEERDAATRSRNVSGTALAKLMILGGKPK